MKNFSPENFFIVSNIEEVVETRYTKTKEKHMRALFGLIYIFLFLGYVLASFFIVFHLSRYALDRKMAFFAILLFLVVTCILLAANVILFFQLPFDSLLMGTSLPFPPR
jgi:hypothetical protein